MIRKEMSERLKRAKERNEKRINRSRSKTLPSGVTPFRTLQAQLCAFDLTKFKGNSEGTLQTPFGTVSVKVDRNCQREIFGPDKIKWSYVNICEQLDGFIQQSILLNGNEAIAIFLIETILEYLERPSIPGIQSINEVTQSIVNIDGLSSNQQSAAACLCGILMLAESHTSRVPTGGKWERAAMRGVLRTKKFDWVFGGNADSGSYISSHSSKESGWRASRQNGFVTGPAQAKSIVEGTKSAFEISESFQENVKLSRNLEEDLSKSSDEEIYKAKCKLCHKFYKLGTNRDILLCDSCREKEEGKNFLLLIENKQLEAAEQYAKLLLSSIDLDDEYAAMFYNLLTSFNKKTADRFYSLLKAKKLFEASMFFGIVMMNIQYSDLIWQVANRYSDTITRYYATILEYCHKFNDLKYSNQFLAFIQNDKIQEAEKFYNFIPTGNFEEAEKFYELHFKN